MTVEGRTHEMHDVRTLGSTVSCCGSNTLETQNSATEKRDGRWPARASCQGPTKPSGVASDHTATERQKCGRDAKRGAEERRRKQEAQSGVDQGRHGGSTETPRKTEETVQATQQGIHKKGTSAGLLWARRFFDAISEEKPRVFDKVTVVLQQRCMSAKQDGWAGRDLGEAAR